MIGDWVFYKNFKGNLVPHKIIGISETFAEFEDPPYNLYKYERMYPIPLTPEILEKNGFTRQDGDEYYKEVYSYQKRKIEELEQGDIEYYIDLRRHPIHGRFEFEEGFVMGGTDDNDEPYGKCTFECNFIYDIRYVHQLQHALKQHETDKEIVL